MKKTILLFITLLMCNFLNAQMDFKQFIDDIDWSSSEKKMLEKFSSSINSRKHFYNDNNKTVTDYEITGILLGNYECTASIIVDSISRKLVELSFSFKGIEKKMGALTLSNELDKLLFSYYGTPDKKEDEMDNKFMNRRNRSWFKEYLIINVNHMIFPDMHLYSLSVKGIEAKSTDFRIAKCGESKSSIMQKEGKLDKANMDRLYLFSDVVAGLDCDVAYIFTDDKLTMAKYVFQVTHTNKNEYITDFNNLVNLMTEKYGKPGYNAPEWRNSLYKNKPEDYGFAISLGHLSYNAGWLGEITDITVALYGENYKISLIIQYLSKKYEAMKDKLDTQSKIKDL